MMARHDSKSRRKLWISREAIRRGLETQRGHKISDEELNAALHRAADFAEEMKRRNLERN